MKISSISGKFINVLIGILSAYNSLLKERLASKQMLSFDLSKKQQIQAKFYWQLIKKS